MATCNVEIQPIDAFIQETFLYDMDPAREGVIPCRIFGVSSYPDFALTFSVHIPETGGTFAFVPFHAVSWLEKPEVTYSQKQLVCKNCPDSEIAVTSYQYLKDQVVWVQLRGGEKVEWSPGSYLFSVDWYQDNELFNIIKLLNGQFCAQPNHRCLFGVNSNELPPYKKLHSEWKV